MKYAKMAYKAYSTNYFFFFAMWQTSLSFSLDLFERKVRSSKPKEKLFESLSEVSAEFFETFLGQLTSFPSLKKPGHFVHLKKLVHFFFH